MTTKESFAKLMQDFLYHFDPSRVFDDFLTLTLCTFNRDYTTGLSRDEDLYLETMKPYVESDLRFHFPKLFAALVNEMEDLVQAKKCPDVLGAYYETTMAKKGLSQFFTPWHICEFMAKATSDEHKIIERHWPLRILEPACGSGRMLIAAYHAHGPGNEYYAVDLDMTCVKMTAINLFLCGVFNAEVVCGNFLLPDEFRGSYRISLLPFGVFRITEKEKSRLWHMLQHKPEPVFPSDETFKKPDSTMTGQQLHFF
jgi:type I restriction-modification system DNA methylase subunit